MYLAIESFHVLKINNCDMFWPPNTLWELKKKN